jgi:class 3 adenylate cyclase
VTTDYRRGGRPETHYAETPNGYVAYQVFGNEAGPDLVFVTHWMNNIDVMWDEPSAARYLDRLATMGRVIFIDKRGSGVSDWPQGRMVDPVQDSLDDIKSVLDVLGSETAVLIGDTEGGMLAMVLAATYPERFPSLILINSYARMRRDDDYSIGAPDDVIQIFEEQWVAQHGTTAAILHFMAPSVADDQRFVSWFKRFQRLSMPLGAASLAVKWVAAADVRSVLPSIQADTLIVHRKDALVYRLPMAEYLAENIKDSKLVVVPGSDVTPFFAGQTGDILDEIEHFITGSKRSIEVDRKLSTVMFTDIVGSTALAADMGDQKWLDLRNEHDRVVREQLERFQGQEIQMTGDGTLATFDGPQRAVQCAMAITSSVKDLDVDIRAGVHTGEIEVRDGEVGGIAVHIASRVMNAAESGGVMVSRTVKDLVIGSELEFKECGVFDLKGVPDTWNLFEVMPPGKKLP